MGYGSGHKLYPPVSFNEKEGRRTGKEPDACPSHNQVRLRLPPHRAILSLGLLLADCCCAPMASILRGW
jgi:hypothetical protein